MPVRYSNSRVLKWPRAEEVIGALKHWADETVRERPEVLRIGYFGSYARGDWGVGSDLPFIERAAKWNTMEMPVAVDVLVYTETEWKGRMQSRGQFRDVVWIDDVN